MVAEEGVFGCQSQGKAAESVFLKPVEDSSDLTPYTKDGVHYVPKLRLDDIVI